VVLHGGAFGMYCLVVLRSIIKSRWAPGEGGKIMRFLSISNVLRLLFFLLGVYGFYVFFRPVLIGIINFGNVVGMLFFICTASLAVFWPGFARLVAVIAKKRFGKIFVIGVAFFLIACFVWATILSVIMIRNILRTPDQRSTVIVLGCRVNGEEPSLALSRRIDAAIEYLEEYPKSVAIVSGGQGPDEDISEAEAMRRRMVDRGIAPERIILEDRSTSTYENLSFSKQIIEENQLGEDTVIITEGYHLTRALHMAESMGIDAQVLASDSVRWLLPTFWVREWFAITASYFSNG